MALMQMLQGLQNPSSTRLFQTFAEKRETVEQILREKDVIIDNHNVRIKELEYDVARLEEKCFNFQQQLAKANEETEREKQKGANEKHEKAEDGRKIAGPNEENEKEEEENAVALQTTSSEPELQTVIQNYEILLSKMIANYTDLKGERDTIFKHLDNLEFAFADLIEKYQRVKKALKGFQDNQTSLLDHMKIYKQAINILQQKYDSFKNYACDKFKEANQHLKNNEKEHISEMAKIKSTVLESKVKISELESTISVMSSHSLVTESTVEKKKIKHTLYVPLKSDIL